MNEVGVTKPKALEWYLKVPFVLMITIIIYSVTFFLFCMKKNDSISEATRQFVQDGLFALLITSVVTFIPIIFMISAFRLLRWRLPENADVITSVAKFGMIFFLVYLVAYPWYVFSIPSSTAGFGFVALPLLGIALIPIAGLLGFMVTDITKYIRQKLAKR